MRKIITSTATAIALATAAPAYAQDPGAIVAEAEEAAQEAVEDAEKLALAEAALDLYWPAGNTEAAVDYMMGPWADRMLDSPIRELAEPFEPVIQMFMEEMGGMMGAMAALEEMESGEEGAEVAEEDGPTAEEEAEQAQQDMAAGIDFIMALYGDMTIRELISAEDEHFSERLTILREVMDEELPALLVEFEEPVRAGLVKVFADRFTSAELAQIAAFADTPAGEKFAANMFTIGFEPEYFAGFLASFPAMIEKAPPFIAKIEERTAHLPPMFPEPEIETAAEDCGDIGDEDAKAECEVEAAAEAVEMEEASEWQPSPEELDEWAAEYQELADDYRRQAEERRAELAAEEATE